MKGYGILKDALSLEDLEGLKKDLTVAPHTGLNTPTREFKTFCESKSRLYIPKNFGLKHFGLPDENKLAECMDVDFVFKGSLRPEQLAPIEAFLEAAKNPSKMGGIIALECGQGKCLGKDTPVMMFPKLDCHKLVVKLCQDVRIGDVLVGDDSGPRVVKSVCRGRELMYKITPSSGSYEPYVVNSSHIMSLMDAHTSSIVDIPINEFVVLPKEKKERLKGFGVALVDNNMEMRINWLKRLVHQRGVCKGNMWYVPCCNCDELNDVWRMCMALGLMPIKDNSENVARVCFLKREYEIMEIFDYVPHTHWTYNFDVENIGENEYFGFEIEGKNRRFLLGDMTVTHNTVCALYIIAALKKKTLVVVHKDFLLNQWKERLSMFLPDARVGIFKAKTQDVKDKDIIIGSLQSLSMKEYDASELFGDVGFMCIDECHRSGAEVFSRLYKRINTRYTLGLSATVSRKDGMSRVFKWHIGDIVYKSASTNKDVVHAMIKVFQCSGSTEYGREITMFNGKLNISKMINVLCDHGPRLEFIVDCICEVFGQDGGDQRKLLVLSDRRAQLKALNTLLVSKGLQCGFYYGGMKPEELKESETKQILLATYAFCAEGLDVPKLDTLLLASPKSDIIQSVGRILREKPINRVNTPVIIDIIDDYSIFRAQAKKREKYYVSKKYTVL
jgi:hypothetical protein